MRDGSAGRPETTADGRYFVVDGRRWRATDPGIPEGLRAELVAELMSARRAVRARESDARERVQDAKVALGERGAPWWDCDSSARVARASATIRTLLRHRPAGGAVRPTDVARVLAGARHRSVGDEVRVAAATLQACGAIEVTRRGTAVDPTEGGPVRLARGPHWPDGSARA